MVRTAGTEHRQVPLGPHLMAGREVAMGLPTGPGCSGGVPKQGRPLPGGGSEAGGARRACGVWAAAASPAKANFFR